MTTFREQIQKIIATHSLKDSTNPITISEEIIDEFTKLIDKHIKKYDGMDWLDEKAALEELKEELKK